MLDRSVRLLLIIAGILSVALAIGFFLQLPGALNIWPWGYGRLSNIFVSSILASMAAGMLWIGVSRRLAGAAGGFLHLATMLGGFAAVLFPLARQRSDPGFMTYMVGCAVAAAVALGCHAWARRKPVIDIRPLPSALRVWCGLYILILLTAGTAMLLRVRGIMPWPIEPETSVLYGWVFIAAAWSFAYPLLRPQAEHIHVGLLGFLAYDAVLLAPFIRHFDGVKPELFNSLMLYVVALTVSAGVSIYYLFFNQQTALTSCEVSGVNQ